MGRDTATQSTGESWFGRLAGRIGATALGSADVD
jgi:hypothetical protein